MPGTVLETADRKMAARHPSLKAQCEKEDRVINTQQLFGVINARGEGCGQRQLNTVQSQRVYQKRNGIGSHRTLEVLFGC